jgi:hypothetical protein
LGADQEVGAVHKAILSSLLLLGSGWLPQAVAAKTKKTERPQSITVAVHDQAGVPRETLQEAERVASGIFEQAGIALEWLNCTKSSARGLAEPRCRQAEYPQPLHLTVLNRSRGLSASALGISFLSSAGEGSYADIFFEAATEIPGADKSDLGLLLGHAAAHELGHLLLGTNSHSVQGLMRARWENPELLQVRSGKLFFSESEARQMQKRIAARREALSQTLGR